jgi:protein tyrosine phosphatase (PTP) superfamily phosphohydrolase (DUF442 family)
MVSASTRFALGTVGLAALALLAGYGAAARADGGAPGSPPPAPPAMDGARGGDAPVEGPERCIHNFFRLSEHVWSGASPETERDFAALAAAGVKTIVSVDGASPDAAAAKRHGMRYVHLPIGYDGIPDETSLRLAKAFSTLAGPFFVHCHHGKHRGPAAASIARIVLDHASPETCVAEMKRAGTDPKYKGLYAAPAAFRVPDAAALAAVSGDFPEVAPVPALQASMVEADKKWERMKSVRMAAWATPKDHPDVEPPHEAVMIAEWFRELARRPDVAEKPAAFKALLADTETAAWDLSKALEPGKLDAKAAEAAFDRVAKSCNACHSQFRDNTPQLHPK